MRQDVIGPDGAGLGMEWDHIGPNGMGWDPIGPDGMGQDLTGPSGMG